MLDFFSKTGRIIRGLKSRSAKRRKRAIESLDSFVKQGLTSRQALKLLFASTSQFPPGENGDDMAVRLIEAAATQVIPAFSDLIEICYSQYSEPAREAALNLLLKINATKADQCFIRMLKAYGYPQVGYLSISLYLLEFQPRNPGIFFPDLITVSSTLELRTPAYHTAIEYCAKGVMRQVDLLPCTALILADYRELRDKLMPMQQSDGVAWKWEDPYFGWFAGAYNLLFLMGFLRLDDVREHLNAALSYHGIRLKEAAVFSLIRLGEIPAREQIEIVAATPLTRSRFLRRLGEMRRTELMPAAHATEALIAESNMVEWLSDPRELMREPDEIELMNVFERDTKKGRGNYYLFRFRTHEPHFSAKDGWQAGYAGPYLKTKPLHEYYEMNAFSMFTPWDEKSPEQHLDAWLDAKRK